jgi:hypothetical protein
MPMQLPGTLHNNDIYLIRLFIIQSGGVVVSW